MLCATILRPLAQTTDLLSERRTMDFSWSMRMSPIFSENVRFVQPFDSMWPKPPTFSHNAEKWTEIDLCEWGQYLPKTYALCNHFTGCSPNFRLFRRMAKSAKTGLKSIYANEANISPKPMLCAAILRHVAQTADFFLERRKMDFNWSMRMSPIFSENVCFVQPFDGMWPKPPNFSHNAEKCTAIDKCECGQYLAKTYALCNHFTAFFAERRKIDWDRSCERVQYLAETYALCNHFTACGPNLRLFRRKAKNGLKLIYANESYILPKPMLCATILRHVAQTKDSFAVRRKMEFNWSPIFSRNVYLVQPFYGM